MYACNFTMIFKVACSYTDCIELQEEFHSLYSCKRNYLALINTWQVVLVMWIEKSKASLQRTRNKSQNIVTS